MLKYKPDWPASQQRFAAFWEGELIDRCCCSLYAPADRPLDSAIAPPRPPRDVQQKWLDAGFRYENALAGFNRTHFGGDAFPLFWINLGPGVAAAYMGGEFGLAPDTVWFDAKPPITDWQKRQPIKMDWDSFMWKTTWEMTKLFSENARGEYHVGMTDLGGNLDIVVSLRGNDKLLYDLYDYPEEIKTACTEINVAWKQAYDRLQALMTSHQQGHSAWMGLWSPGTWYPLQCDFSAMISRPMFDEFVTPWLAREAKWFADGVSHLDGPGEIPHLESILDIEEINAIQCVPGDMFQSDGKAWQSFANEMWMPVMKRIQEKGRRLILLGFNPKERDAIMENLSPKGLYLTMFLPSQSDAQDVLRRIEAWK